MGKTQNNKTVEDFLTGKTGYTCELFDHFVNEFMKVGHVTLHPAKTMIGVSNGEKRIAWITQLGKNFIHVVFPFEKAYPENLCFEKIARVPGDSKQFNHHFRMYYVADVNKEVLQFMKMAYGNK